VVPCSCIFKQYAVATGGPSRIAGAVSVPRRRKCALSLSLCRSSLCLCGNETAGKGACGTDPRRCAVVPRWNDCRGWRPSCPRAAKLQLACDELDWIVTVCSLGFTAGELRKALIYRGLRCVRKTPKAVFDIDLPRHGKPRACGRSSRGRRSAQASW
jgi:hypothetical protein